MKEKKFSKNHPIIKSGASKAVKEEAWSGKNSSPDMRSVSFRYRCRGKVKALNAFVKGDVTVIVATISFGMDVNDGYYQECGRTGRDGQVGDCRLFWFSDDVKMRKQGIIGRPDYVEKEDTHYAKSLDIG
ncbi:ATP-dependent DNA helicase [Brachionus plicatilis]|uniref:ATP-dependent DNA helicase n=1 Tax=Brachionus plicatilis TaxID=10195 RepID=A0A3M7R3C6_BRAPC|nr:ATP-dependent DNA helicase [Brachionus plicatilis]